MAKSRIQGITIEIDGNTTGLQNALKDVNKKSVELNQELKDVNRLLKFDPGNAELIAQKQQLLSQQVENTSNKLNQLKQAQSQVEAQFKSGDIGEAQYRAFRREIESTEGQLKGLKTQLSKVNGDSFKDLKKDAEKAKESVGELGSEMAGVAAGIVAGGGIAGAISGALDVSGLDTSIEVSIEVPEESKAAVKEAVRGIESYGVDAESALEGVRRQWSLNKDASDESNAAVVQGAATISSAYAGIDFTELIQETNEISRELKITNEEALGLTNSLLKMGFPPEQLDIIAEYGAQLQRAGYDAQEIQAIMAAGVETGTWNIDNLLDGLKEGRIRVAEFGDTIPDAMLALLDGTKITTEQLQEWGNAVSKGGEEGSAAMQEIATALNGVDDETKKNLLGVQIFGTMYEDQGQNIIDTLLNAKDATVDLKAGQDSLNESTSKLDASPAVQMKQGFADLKTALEPLLLVIANVISQVAKWVSNNPQLAATVTAVVTAVGILLGLIMALAPLFTALSTAAVALQIGMLPLTGIIAGVVAAIALLVAAGVLIYQNWDTIKSKAIEIWGAISTFLSGLWKSISQTASNSWNSMKDTISNVWGNVKVFFSTTWDGIKSIFSSILSAIKGVLNQYWNSMKEGVTKVWDGIKTYFDGAWKVIKNVFLGALVIIMDLLSGNWSDAKKHTEQIWNNIKDGLSQMWDGVKKVFSGALSAVTGFVKTYWTNIKTTTSSVWEGIKKFLSSTVDNIKSFVVNGFESLKNSVQEKMNNVKNKVTEIWNQVISFLKGIDLRQIGKDAIQGLINGMADLAGKVWEKAKEIAGSIKEAAMNILDINSPSKEMQKIGQWAGEGLVLGLESTENDVKKQSEELAKIVSEEAEDTVKLSKWQMREMNKIYNLGYTERYKAVEDWITQQYQLETINVKDEIKLWTYATKEFELNAADQRRASINLREAKLKLYNDVKTAGEDYLNKTREINQQMIDEERRLTEAYQKSVQDRTNALYNFAGIFDEIKTNSEVTGAQLISNLQGQVNAFADWSEDIKELAGKGIDEGLLEELRQMGPRAASEIAALNTLSEQELQKYNELWKEKNALAKEQAVSELEGLKSETTTKIEELHHNTANQLELLRVEWIAKMKGISSGTTTEFDVLAATMPEMGNNIIDGLIAGLDEKTGELIGKAKQIADTIRETIQSALDIHSPSRVTTWMGEMIGDGLIKGMQNSIAGIEVMSREMAHASTSSLQQPSINNSKSYQNTINISAGGSANEIARAVERAERRMAFQFN